MPHQEAAPRVWISFDLIRHEREGSPFDPDYVSEQLGVEPTQKNKIGDSIRKGVGRRTFTRWRVSVGPVETIDIAPMLSEVMTYLRPADGKLRSLCDELGIQPKLTCAVEPKSAQAPDVTFPHTVVEWAAAQGVEIGVDIMLWRRDEE